jgi:hypothetical protein
VSAELSALREEVKTRILGKFFRNRDILKAISQQQFQIMNIQGEKSDIITGDETNMIYRIHKLELDFILEIIKVSERIDRLHSYIKIPQVL